MGVAWLLKGTILKAPTTPLVLELPPYRLPHLQTVLHSIFSRGWLFVRRAGTVILAISIILWVLVTLSRTSSTTDTGEQLRNSYAGRAGRAIEPLIAPLGFDWKMGVALISSFAARETLVSTLGIIYNAGPGDSAESSPSLVDAVREARRSDGTAA
ncbi:MAG: nucleoside recognition domain-containing protein [Pyrinomonadaceae bacterium]